MKLKFKVQPYQTNAVESVVDCFAGQPMTSGLTYRIDPGRIAQVSVQGTVRFARGVIGGGVGGMVDGTVG